MLRLKSKEILAGSEVTEVCTLPIRFESACTVFVFGEYEQTALARTGQRERQMEGGREGGRERERVREGERDSNPLRLRRACAAHCSKLNSSVDLESEKPGI